MEERVTFETVQTPEQKAEFKDMLRQVANELMARNMPLWGEEDLSDQALFSEGQAYICRVEGKPAGTFILCDSDGLFWPHITDGKSLFVHKVSVGKGFNGMGISHRMLEFARQEALRRHREYMRLDCRCERLKLRAVYEDFGFTFVGITYLIDKTCAKYEIRL